jgi:pyruvate, water dikinase
MPEYVIPLDHPRASEVARVGGKNASLGQMIAHLKPAGVRVPGGFATTARAYRHFLAHGMLDRRIYAALDALNIEDIDALAATGQTIREWIVRMPFPPALEEAITKAYQTLQSSAPGGFAVAVRSSATAEDLPEASFAGQQETYLNVRGLEETLAAIKDVFASLFNDRAIAYRVHQGFAHRDVALSAGVQRMVRSDIGASGVMFTLDTESGFRGVVLITANYGLGETVVQGEVNPDEFCVYKPSLAEGRRAILSRRLGGKALRMVYANVAGHANSTRLEPVPEGERLQFCISDAEVEELARQAVIIERHYGCPMDIEWARDGEDGQIYILQARPETVQSRTGRVIEHYELGEKSAVLSSGRAIGQKIGAGTARVILSLAEMGRVQAGEVLVTDMTDPHWEPVMKRASAIVTNRGGRTCHAAIIARELGIPAVVGCGDATSVIGDGAEVTVSCAEGETGFIYRGKLPFEVSRTALDRMPEIPVKLMLNVGSPDQAFAFAELPNAGVGLARLEFIIARTIGVHPRALIEYDTLPLELKAEIQPRIAAYPDPVSFYVEKLTEGIATIAAAFAPNPVIVRLSDFKSNEYANLLGGKRYEPLEENPMLGFRGADRYLADSFRPSLDLECRAIKKVREEMGLTNVEIMVPFVRTVAEGKAVVAALAEHGLRRGEHGLRIIMMCEVPSNAILAQQFLESFDGFSIGSNDLTQLTLGLDRDSELVAKSFDERDDAVKFLLQRAIQACRAQGKYVGICGQGPSDHPDLALWLLEQGIESMSLNPDTAVKTWLHLAQQTSKIQHPRHVGHSSAQDSEAPMARPSAASLKGTQAEVARSRRAVK